MKSEILAALKNNQDFVSGQELCEALGVSRTAVWKGIKSLQASGYLIEAVSNRGYRLLHSPDILSRDELQSIRRTDWAANMIYFYPETDSTNTQAKRLAEDGCPHGTLVVADRQTGGKGRRGRSWDSEQGTGIYMTLVIKPEFVPAAAPMLTLVAALAVTKALRERFEIPAQIKWPNDIVLNGKKICGILTEMSAEIDYIHYIAVGIGVNVLQTTFDEALQMTATSLYLETGKSIRRADLIEAVWEEFEQYYQIFLQTQDLTGMCKEYHRYLVNVGQRVKVHDAKEPYEGKAMGITVRGELIVDTWDSRKLVSAGEVSVRGIYGYV